MLACCYKPKKKMNNQNNYRDSITLHLILWHIFKILETKDNSFFLLESIPLPAGL